MQNDLFYIDRLQAVNVLRDTLNINITTDYLRNIMWDFRKYCFYDCSNRTMDIIATYQAQYGAGFPAQEVPECLLYLEDSQNDSRIALFIIPDVIAAAMSIQAWYTFDGEDEEYDRFINDLRARLLDMHAFECREEYDLYLESMSAA